ncbi:MAG: hypothetical protein KAJ47_01715 [Candidatus Aenigmarchaeota archaeon]|nr:hypothetical protein [Candidatus Aenigmarchaeota archaeon]
MYRKGQISFDYIAGFAIFMVSVIYITNTLIASVPQNYQLIEKNDMKQIAWIQSDRLMSDIEKKDYELDENIIDSFYTYYISQGEWIESLSKIQFTVYPIIIAETKVQDGNESIVIFEKNSGGPIHATFLINMTKEGNKLIRRIKCSEDNDPSIYKYEGDTITIGSKIYTVKTIDQKGNYAVLEYRPKGISLGAESINKYVTKRYSTYDGFITEIIIESINRDI